ncbi:uncharacterized protein At2g33490-like isoform X1 [Ziziphus jujuba]|uniref:Uncharacterized protein At2g33490-like isoform X1 n=1 Tax=Ziziphus jujuba TaxID=326968 RepID=A0A6P4AF46_ZIZJJ|nr:uncharacterized protein At2g33490-like isoform X1 [Ziziphus jujuba]
MKSPLAKLRRFGINKNDSKDKRDFQPSAQLDELAQAAKDMQDMRNCYDSLLSAAAATANSAYEFSESLREMGACLLEKTALHDDEESGRALLKLGKVQYELQKLVDSYRAHVIQTITNPSESLLHELRTVEHLCWFVNCAQYRDSLVQEMKRQCDEKRDIYEYMVAQQKEKGRSKSGKSESLSFQQLKAAHDEYDEEATLCVFRLKSLKQGQSRSLLTQAARHHAAQLNFFRKGLKSLEAVDPHVRLITEQQHIEYQFSGLEDDDGEDREYGNDDNAYRELSFDYRTNKHGFDAVPTSMNSMEVDEEENSSPQASKLESPEIILDKSQADLLVPSRDVRVGSYSAPILAEKKFDPAEKVRQIQASAARKSNTYVLPTPIDAKGSISSKNTSSINPRPGGRAHLWHSSPLEEKKHEKDYGDGNLSGSNNIKAQLTLKESSTKSSILLPPPLAEGLPLPQHDTVNVSDTKKIKAFSGPLTSKSSSTKPVLSASGPIASADLPHLVSGMVSRLPVPQSSSPKVSPSASPPPVSSPKISELHELPRPPGSLAAKPSRTPGLVGHSAPLYFRNHELNPTNRVPLVASNKASPLPTPPMVVPRSFSIPSSSQRSMTLHVTKHFDSHQVSNKAENVTSPPLTPISLANIKPGPTVSEVATQSSPIQVDAGAG